MGEHRHPVDLVHARDPEPNALRVELPGPRHEGLLDLAGRQVGDVLSLHGGHSFGRD